MQIHRIRGKSLRDALERARAQHGESALVLSHESMPDGQVMVAVTERRPQPRPLEEVEDPGLLDVRRRLEGSGASSQLTGRVLEAVRDSGARGAFAIDAAAVAIGERFRIAPSPKPGSGTVAIAFVGPTGVGKTTTIAKLASRLVRSRRRVALTSTDTTRIAGTQQLESYAKLLQVPFRVANGGAELCEVAARSRSADILLIDTGGSSPQDREALGTLSSALQLASDGLALNTWLVLAASTSRAALDDSVGAFQNVRPTAAVVTKLDETRQPAPALEYAALAGLPLAFLCDGQEVSRHLRRASADRLADVLLRGRLR